MEYMSNCDFYEVRLGSVLSDSDRNVLINLYQPIVGPVAIALFFKFWSDAEVDQEKGFYSIDKLITYMHVTSDIVLNARRHLEAMGLIKTYVKEINDERKSYMFCLYSPKQPQEFFEDIFFKELLIKYIGEKDVQRLANFYKNKIDTTDYKNITTTFGEVFVNDVYNLKFASQVDTLLLKGKKEGNVYTSFDIGKFVTLLANKNIKESFLTKQELEKISKIATIYGAKEEILAEYFEFYCDFDAKNGERIIFDKLIETLKNVNNYSNVMPKKTKNKLHNIDATDGKYKDMIRLMEITPSAQYLSLLQNNTVPSNADLTLVSTLATNYNLNNGVINALISYVLEVKDNTLPKNYVEKIAASLAREGVTSVVEALNYLNKVNKKSKKTQTKATNYSAKPTKKLFDEDDNVEYNEDLDDED